MTLIIVQRHGDLAVTLSVCLEEVQWSILKKFWRAGCASATSWATSWARVVMTLFYFTILLPFGVIVTLFSDPLDQKHKDKPPAWHARTTGDRTLEEARRQF